MQAYRDAGFPDDAALAAVQAVAFVVLSFAATEAQWPDALEVTAGALAASTDEPPAPRRRTPRPNDEMFDFLLGSIIASLERRLQDAVRPG